MFDVQLNEMITRRHESHSQNRLRGARIEEDLVESDNASKFQSGPSQSLQLVPGKGTKERWSTTPKSCRAATGPLLMGSHEHRAADIWLKSSPHDRLDREIQTVHG